MPTRVARGRPGRESVTATLLLLHTFQATVALALHGLAGGGLINNEDNSSDDEQCDPLESSGHVHPDSQEFHDEQFGPLAITISLHRLMIIKP